MLLHTLYLRDSVIFIYSLSTVLLFVTIDRSDQKERKKPRLYFSLLLTLFLRLAYFLSFASYDSYIPLSFAVFFCFVLFCCVVICRYDRLLSIDFCWPLHLPCHSSGVGRCHAIPLVFPHPPISSRYPCILASFTPELDYLFFFYPHQPESLSFKEGNKFFFAFTGCQI